MKSTTTLKRIKMNHKNQQDAKLIENNCGSSIILYTHQNRKRITMRSLNHGRMRKLTKEKMQQSLPTSKNIVLEPSSKSFLL